MKGGIGIVGANSICPFNIAGRERGNGRIPFYVIPVQAEILDAFLQIPFLVIIESRGSVKRV
ncbi:hypothetical protein AGMMS49938_08380 [Fibrobacterales bacterium]|nr:hypothetical protein AGMMS49938_08380 [Fibrobacterales bacterium]